MRLAVVLVAVLGLWLQAMLPASAAMSAPQVAGLAVFCGHAATQSSLPGQAAHDHRHCLLCQAGSPVAILPPQPHASSSAQAIALVRPIVGAAAAAAAFRAYASRAPPELG